MSVPPQTPTPAAPKRNREVADFSSPEKSPEAVEVSSQAHGTRTSPIQRLFGKGRSKKSRQNEPTPVQHDHDEGAPGAGQGERRDAEEVPVAEGPGNGGSRGGLGRAFRTWSGQSGRSKKKSKGRLTLAHLLEPLQPQEVEPETGAPGPSSGADAAQQQAARPRSVASASSAASRAGSVRSLRSAMERMKRDEATRLEVQRHYARHGSPSPQIARTEREHEELHRPLLLGTKLVVVPAGQIIVSEDPAECAKVARSRRLKANEVHNLAIPVPVDQVKHRGLVGKQVFIGLRQPFAESLRAGGYRTDSVRVTMWDLQHKVVLEYSMSLLQTNSQEKLPDLVLWVEVKDGELLEKEEFEAERDSGRHSGVEQPAATLVGKGKGKIVGTRTPGLDLWRRPPAQANAPAGPSTVAADAAAPTALPVSTSSSSEQDVGELQALVSRLLKAGNEEREKHEKETADREARYAKLEAEKKEEVASRDGRIAELEKFNAELQTRYEVLKRKYKKLKELGAAAAAATASLARSNSDSE